MEEFQELCAASLNENSATAQQILESLQQAQKHIRQLEETDKDLNLVEIADALTDINYVTYGAGHCYGIDLDSCMTEVQKSNMSKLGKDGKPLFNSMGKVMKGPNYQKPNLAKLLYDEL